MFKDKLFFLEGCYTLISVSLPDLLPQNFNCILFCKKLSFLEGHCTIKYFLNFCYTYFFPGHKQHFILQRVIFLRGMLHLNIFFFNFFFKQIFFPTVLMDRMIAAGGALLFSLFIVFDTSMMMHKLSPEEYIVASVNLYLDILNLFLHLLRLMGERK